jgi:CHASE2 domain-containing sensor protein
MTRAFFLRIAAALSLTTCFGHTLGTFMAVPPEHAQIHATIASMKATMVPMPVGSARSYMEILDGNNLSTSLFLAVCAALLFSVARAKREPLVDQVIGLTALGLAGISVISFRYFFPVPAVFTGVAAVLSLVARARETSAS